MSWRPGLSRTRRRQSVRRHGKGPFKIHKIENTPPDLMVSIEHSQVMLLESRDPQVLVSGALLVRQDA
ncbi:MAG: hypothetical protein V4682_03905 [Patescibacteria group bacterium]